MLAVDLLIWIFFSQPVPAFPNSARSANPFDLNDERTQVQAPPVCTTFQLILCSRITVYIFLYPDFLGHFDTLKYKVCLFRPSMNAYFFFYL
jgi:hypothetical protein